MAFKFSLSEYQKDLLRKQSAFRMLLLYYRRQARKTSTCALQGLDWMAQAPGTLVTFATCSLNLGAEMSEREIEMLLSIVDSIKTGAASARNEVLVDTHIDEKKDDWTTLDWSDVAELYQKSKLEVKLYHSRSSYSRTKIIAPNIATARGFTGYVILDEIGFIRDFKGFFEAVEPIIASNPDFHLWMSTTPPEDDAHFSYELLAAPPDLKFDVNPKGNWYENDYGMPVHRVDAWDASAAGVPLYSTRTGEKVTADQHRSISVDKDAWDRNYGLKPPMTGKSACSLTALHAAQLKGQEYNCKWYVDELPTNWQSNLVDGAETTIGIDPATTTKEKSNPTGLAITQKIDGLQVAKILMRYKRSDPKEARAIIRDIAEAIHPRCVVLDATSEKYWCAETKAELEYICPIILIVNSERIEYENESMTYKSYLGNIAVNALEDYRAALPPDKACKDDFRLVKRYKGGFDNDEDSSGNHADTFDGYKNSLYGFICDVGRIEATATPTGHAADPDPHKKNRMTMRPDHSDDGCNSTKQKLIS